jgi:serine acetyltransferase
MSLSNTSREGSWHAPIRPFQIRRRLAALAPRRLVSFVHQIREDWEWNDHDWTLPGFRALAVYRFGRFASQLSRGLLRTGLLRLHKALFRYVRNHYGIELPVSAAIGRKISIGHQGGIVIHTNAVIGDECIIRQHVTIGTATLERGYDAPTLGRGVQLGIGAAVLGAVTIGDGARIGPYAVVMTNVPAETSVFVAAPRIVVSPRSRRERRLAPTLEADRSTTQSEAVTATKTELR